MISRAAEDAGRNAVSSWASKIPGARARATTSPIPSRDRLPSLTGLRFWAALLVVLYHFTAIVGPVQPISAMVMLGRTGVTFFFVLSGFVLAWTYLDGSVPFRVFAWRRLARLWPLLAVTAVLSLAVFRVIGTPIPWLQAMTTFLFLQAWRPEWAVGANGAAWSLSDEAFFYLTFPALLALAARRRTVLWVAVGVVVPVLWGCYMAFAWSHFRLDYFPPSRLVQFALGVACAVAMRRGVRAPISYWPAVALVFVYHLALIPWSHFSTGLHPSFDPYSGSQWWAAPIFALLIMAAADRDRSGLWTGVQGPWALRLGHWSYALYLVHEVIVRAWIAFAPLPTTGVQVAASWAVLLVLALVVAGALYTLVERPAERWLRARGPR